MSIRSVEAKSETGRSGAKVEFDKSTNTVKITGFYDTYVKLNLRKNEWSLEDFLSILGIDEAIEKKYKKESKDMVSNDSKVLEVKVDKSNKTKRTSSTKEQPHNTSEEKPLKSSTSKKKVSKEVVVASKKSAITKVATPKVKTPKAPKVKVEKTVVPKIRPKKLEFSIVDKSFQMELKNLKIPTVCFKFRKEKPDTDKGSVYMFITHAGNRVRFVPKGCNLLSEDIFDSKSRKLNTEHPKFSDICKYIDLAVSKCRKAFENIDSKYKKDPSKYISKIELDNVKKQILE